MANGVYKAAQKRLLELAVQVATDQTLFVVVTGDGFELKALPDHRSAEGPERSD